MKRTKHFFNNHIYHISSIATARCAIFHNKKSCDRFLSKLDKYLSPICTILHYSLHESGFHCLIKLKDRKTFETFFRTKYKREGLESKDIPHSTFIFSQQVANLLSSTAIHYNRANRRFGALFASRFHRKLVKNKSELSNLINQMNKMNFELKYVKKWSYAKRKEHRRKWKRKHSILKERCGYYFYKKRNKVHGILSNFKRVDQIDLRGQFENLPPNNIYSILDRLTFIFYIKKKTSPT